MFAQRRRRWANIGQTLGRCVVFAVKWINGTDVDGGTILAIKLDVLAQGLAYAFDPDLNQNQDYGSCSLGINVTDRETVKKWGCDRMEIDTLIKPQGTRYTSPC